MGDDLLERSTRRIKQKGSSKKRNRKDNNDTKTCDAGEMSVKKRKPKKRTEKDKEVDPLANPSDKAKENFEKFMTETFNDGPEKLIKEYETIIKPYFPADLKRAIFDANPDKNRYKDIVCNDNTRVILTEGKGPDYIHANYVRGEPLMNSFICTQGPTEKTINEFARMIVQEKVRTIFMLCELMEAGKKKCERYWPEKVGDKMIIGDITITTIDAIEKDAHTFVTTLEFTAPQRTLTLKHYQWKTWPDKSVPKSLLAVFRLLKNSRCSKSPTVVHCSAGIGRTGTLVAVEMCLQRLYTDKEFKRVEIIKLLKDQRCHSVQMDVQYVYAMTALCEYGKAMMLVEKEEVLNRYNKFLDDYEEMLKKKEAEALANPPAKT